jgi:large exoprotein involved in heme utilization and adhesion
LSDGNAGAINLQVQALTISDGGFIASSTRGSSGQGGLVQIDATGTVSIFGLDADGNLSGVFSTVGADGMGGAIVITAGRLEVFNDGIVTTTTSGSGDGGSIAIAAGEILLASGGSIAAGTTNSGNAGNITMTAGGTVLLDGAGTGLFTESTSTAPDAGTAGDITVAAQEMQIANDAQISTESATADGGDIDLSLVSMLLMQDSAITTSVGTGTGAGGNIFIDPVFVILDSSVIQANAFGGPGGNITIIAENFLASPDSLVEASSALGISGTVAISAPETDLSAGVAVLTSTLMDAAARLAKQCGARGGRTLASFVGKGRGTLPVQPGAAMMAHYLGDVGNKLGAALEDGVAMQIAMGAMQPRDARAFLVAGTLQLSCVE